MTGPPFAVGDGGDVVPAIGGGDAVGIAEGGGDEETGEKLRDGGGVAAAAPATMRTNEVATSFDVSWSLVLLLERAVREKFPPRVVAPKDMEAERVWPGRNALAVPSTELPVASGVTTSCSLPAGEEEVVAPTKENPGGSDSRKLTVLASLGPSCCRPTFTTKVPPGGTMDGAAILVATSARVLRVTRASA
jgi:hypothetical protein